MFIYHNCVRLNLSLVFLVFFLIKYACGVCRARVANVARVVPYLTNSQWMSINRILKSQAVDSQTMNIQRLTRTVIYDSYDAWAVQQAYLYKRRYWRVCRDVRTDDLAAYSRIGLYKATQKYDPNKCGQFVKYASIYLHGELYKGVRGLRPKCRPLSEMPEMSERISLYDNLRDNCADIYEWRNLTDFEYQCMTKKYMMIEGDGGGGGRGCGGGRGGKKQRSNAEVARQMGCSEEWVRLTIKRVLQGYL